MKVFAYSNLNSEQENDPFHKMINFSLLQNKVVLILVNLDHQKRHELFVLYFYTSILLIGKFVLLFILEYIVNLFILFVTFAEILE